MNNHQQNPQVNTYINPDIYFIIKSFMDDKRVRREWSEDLGGEVGLVAAASRIAVDFLARVEKEIDFDEYDEGCFPYEMEEHFVDAYIDVCSLTRCHHGEDGVACFDERENDEFYKMCELLKLPRKETPRPIVYQVVEHDKDGASAIGGRHNSWENARDTFAIGLGDPMSSYVIGEYYVNPDTTVEHIRDLLFDGTPVEIVRK